MTFTEIRQAILDYTLLSSTDAQTRIGKAINRHYRRITASLGLDAARFVTRSASTSLGVQTVNFAEIEKIDRVLDTTDSTAIRLLQEVSVHQIRSTQPTAGQPGSWAFQNADADSATILLDTVPQAVYSLQADGWTTLSDLSGTDEPVFPESYHDVLVWFVVHEELLKKEKDKLAATYAAKADATLRDLRFFLADSHTHETQQASGAPPLGSSGGSGTGTGNQGGTAYTQSGLLTFDRGAGIVPFAVARSDAPYVVNLGAEFLGNITTDRLIGRDTASTGETEQLTVGGGLEFTGSGGIQRSALTGDVSASAGSGTTAIGALKVTTAMIAADAVTYAKLQNVSAASKLLGRGSAAGAGDPEEITLGSNLTMTGTTLSATGTVAAGSDTQIQFNDGGTALGGDAGLTYNKTTDALTIVGALTVGGLITATAGQIKFPATQNPSADANTLDDYEEGTWTPTVGGTSTYTNQEGTYTKIGRAVFVRAFMEINAIGTGSTTTISGLPFTAANHSAGTCPYWANSVISTYSMGCRVPAGSTTLTFQTQTALDGSMADGAAIFQNATSVMVSATFFV